MCFHISCRSFKCWDLVTSLPCCAVLVWAGPEPTSSWTVCWNRSEKKAPSTSQASSNTSEHRGTTWSRLRSASRRPANVYSIMWCVGFFLSLGLLQHLFCLHLTGTVCFYPQCPGRSHSLRWDECCCSSVTQVCWRAADPRACWENTPGCPV